ncbi:unnamed protein product [Aphis gossypii]|uniref:Uncharacterized protein n=1 Tax=Aphis gossypii TaxID=80765 RepID=A0A9P0IUW5_APHGO|nr:unnamed protein product [Aphis gossypii]
MFNDVSLYYCCEKKKSEKKRRKNTSATNTRIRRQTARASCRGRTGARQGRLTVDDARRGRHESRSGGSSDTHTHTQQTRRIYGRRRHLYESKQVRLRIGGGSGHQVVIIVVVAVVAAAVSRKCPSPPWPTATRLPPDSHSSPVHEMVFTTLGQWNKDEMSCGQPPIFYTSIYNPKWLKSKISTSTT